MAGSSVSETSSIGAVTFAPLTRTGRPGMAGQDRHGALNQALLQVRNGAVA